MRDPKTPLLPVGEPVAFALEEERFPDGSRRPMATVFVRNGECPLACVYCGLYRNTDRRPASGAEVALQIRRVRQRFPQARGIKVYNASSLFEPASIAQEGLVEIAASLAGLDLAVVEARSEHARAAAAFARILETPLEVAVGLEVADDILLRRLNKPTSVASFLWAADVFAESGIHLRAFVLLQPPFVCPEDAVGLAIRTFELAREARARVVTFLPVVATHLALDRLESAGFFAPPTLETVRQAVAPCLGRGPIVLVETEHLARLAGCPSCAVRQREALASLNRDGVLPGVPCADHDPPTAVPVHVFAKDAVLSALR